MRAGRLLMRCWAVLGAVAPALAAGEATFTPLGDLPGGEFHSSAFGVSDDGAVVVGWSTANARMSGQYRAFRWTEAAGMEPLGHLGSPNVNGSAHAVSHDGSVIVGHSGGAFIWTKETGMVGIGDCSALGVSADGTIVVGSCFGGQGLEASMWTAETGWVLFGDIGPEGDVVDSFFSGISADGLVASGQSMVEEPNVEPVRWTKREGMIGLGDVPGGAHYALGWAISADGSTIVGDAIGDVELDAFRWTAETGLENLEDSNPGVTASTARDVSADGALIVGYADGLGAMIWDRAHGMRSLQQVLVNDFRLDLAGWTLLGASAITPDGRTIVGTAENPDGHFEAWRATIPSLLTPGDLNHDGMVGPADLAQLLDAWGPCADCDDCPADFNGNCAVGPEDLALLLDNWG